VLNNEDAFHGIQIRDLSQSNTNWNLAV